MTTSYYGLSTATVDAGNANNLTSTGGGSATTPTTGTQVFNFTGWMQLLARGGSTSVLGAIGVPNGHGWLLDTTELVGTTIPAGDWQAKITLQASDASCDGALTVRVYDLDLLSVVYTLLGSAASGAEW